ncbi:hypothetical protein CC77DRAFT_675842 [Alternaria alternata]|uniref:Secreted protein n=1 Tax=Alternaria alternata TaxID=5599 RepID=A0A177D0Q8_ALTAL|nr:hypothetical protein CC77DRAFT_675842 [Alternaria alternata]OAG13254.1 hypothetical protein CC77DRAFT_675842 [Alternaria alternata]
MPAAAHPLAWRCFFFVHLVPKSSCCRLRHRLCAPLPSVYHHHHRRSRIGNTPSVASTPRHYCYCPHPRTTLPTLHSTLITSPNRSPSTIMQRD